ncbi:unnamed protein product [Hermetia illucens]|uniref:Uncharacterized protein n=2 Tax=Hermetia illucens TaxID=343691 RepID=A0A7R8YRT9_HERIL|nr:unnamed protein product [Hermetia illucens]
MSCISSNFSSFFLDSLNDPSEFAKYLGNSENKTQTFDDQIYGAPGTTNGNGYGPGPMDSEMASFSASYTNSHHPHQQQQDPHANHVANNTQSATFFQQQPQAQHPQSPHHQQPQLHQNHHAPAAPQQTTSQPYPLPGADVTTVIANHTPSQPQQESSFVDNTFDFSKYLNNSEYGTPSGATVDSAAAAAQNQLMDLDNTPPSGASGRAASTSNSVDIDAFDHDSKNLYDIHNSNESGMSDQRISSNTSECSDSSNQANQTKPLTKFMIKENFEVHPAHKVEEGIFQHMNKLPVKKKDTLKTLGVTFTGHMSVADKAIIVDNFAKFCEEYGVTDHRPFLSLNQSGMQKPEQIKFARFLGQGLPKFTLFCIYSNFKNMFCIKRFENYAKGSYNLQYILDKTKRFLTCTTADLKNLTPQMFDSTDSPPPVPPPPPPTNVNGATKQEFSKVLERLTIFENFDVHESHRIEDGIFTHIGRLSPKKQELLKKFGIQSNHTVTFSEKCTIIDNFIKFSRAYNIEDHRPFLDFHESGLPKMEQIKFARYLGQGLPNLTLYKIYSAFKDLLALNRIEKLISEGYNLDVILKKKRKNLINRLNAAKRSNKETTEATNQQPNQPNQPNLQQPQPQPQPQAQQPQPPQQQPIQTPFENMVTS